MEVASGWWSPGEASLVFTASVLLVMGRGLFHFRSLSVSTFMVFAAISTAVVSLRISGVLVSPTLTFVGLEFLRWTVNLQPLPFPHFLLMGEEDLVSWVSASRFSVPFWLF